jgi:hypothetical protein
MLKWKIEEIFTGLFGKYPADEAVIFLNTLPEERALEAKIIISSTFVWIYYREEVNNAH